MSEILGKIFGFGDQIKRNLRDAYKDPQGYLENITHQNNIEWKRNPDERSMGFFNPVPLGTMGNFVMRKELSDAVTNLSRRDFLKKSAGIAGGSAAASIPGSKLLQKFAPEERALAKEAAVEAAPKHRYNSLKEYLDDAQMWAKEDFKAADLSGQGARYSKDEFLKRQLLADEERYLQAKDYKDWAGHPEIDPLSKQELSKVHEALDKELNKFSPQAKKEMKEYKDWTNSSSYTADQWANPRVLGDYLMDGAL